MINLYSEQYLTTIGSATVFCGLVLWAGLMLALISFLYSRLVTTYVWLFIGSSNLVQYYIDRKGREEAIRKVKSIKVVEHSTGELG